KSLSRAGGERAVFLAPKEIQSKDDVPGKMWVTESKTGPWRKSLHVFAVWAQPDVRGGVWLSCSEEQRRRDEEAFQRIALSFQWFDGKAKEATSQVVLKDLGLSEEKRKA